MVVEPPQGAWISATVGDGGFAAGSGEGTDGATVLVCATGVSWRRDQGRTGMDGEIGEADGSDAVRCDGWFRDRAKLTSVQAVEPDRSRE